MRVGIDTDAFDPNERLKKWREALCDTYVGLDSRFEREDFRAVIDGVVLSDYVVSRMTSTGHSVQRSRTLIKRDGREVIFVVLVKQGTVAIYQDGREAVLGPGEMAFDDSTRPFRSNMGAGSDAMRLSLPKASLAALVPGLDDLSATAFAPTLALQRIAFDFLTALHPALGDDRTIGQASLLLDQARQLVAMTLLSRARARLR